MARERRSTPMPEAIPEPDPNEVSNRFDVTDLAEERAAALAPKKVSAREHRPSPDPITSAENKMASGGFDLKIFRPGHGMTTRGEKVVVSDEAYSKDKDKKEATTETVANTNTQEKPKAVPPPPPRKRRASSEAITSKDSSEVSGEIRSKGENLEDLTEHAVLVEEPKEPSVDDDEPYAEMTITQEKPKAVPPPRKRRTSSEAITSEDSSEISGVIRPKGENIEDLTEHAVLVEEPKEPSVDDDEPYAEMTITRDETPTEAPVAPRRKRAKRIEMSAQALADKLAADTAKEKEQRLAEMSARIDKALEEEDTKEAKEKEESWFKQGEDESYVKKLAEKQQIEDTQKAADVRRHIAETYDRKESETILATGDEVEATAKQAEAMLASGELSAEVFNVKDYRYLLIEKARLERELETAGWWQARKLRSELKETDKNLADYEQQITSVHSERAALRAAATKPAEGPWRGTRILPPGTGTTKKTSFFARLFGR